VLVRVEVRLDDRLDRVRHRSGRDRIAVSDERVAEINPRAVAARLPVDGVMANQAALREETMCAALHELLDRLGVALRPRTRPA
jgi:hypothetical protein